jgi:hypothetical protein
MMAETNSFFGVARGACNYSGGDSPFIERQLGFIGMYRASVPGMNFKLPMVQACTARNNEVALAEDAFEVLDDHTSSFWFRDRAGWVLAYRMARFATSFGLRFFSGDHPSGVLLELRFADATQVFAVTSRHHADPELEAV